MAPVRLSGMDEFFEVYGSATGILDRPDTEIAPDDGGSIGTEEWFTLKGPVGRCACGHSSPYLCETREPHRVIVFPADDDPNLRKVMRLFNGEPVEVVRYERSMGDCISYYKVRPS